MDCFFHHAVPSVARCTDCAKPVCATCRAESASCPSCRLAARIDAASAARAPLGGGVGPSHGTYQEPPPPQPPPYAAYQQSAPQTQAPPRDAALATRPESRALVARGYPFWPLALIALFDPSGSPFVRRHALQALGFNAGMYGIGWLVAMIATIPLVGMSAWPLLPFIVPVTIVASVVYGIKAWHGEDVQVPFVSEFVDKKLTPTG